MFTFNTAALDGQACELGLQKAVEVLKEIHKKYDGLVQKDQQAFYQSRMLRFSEEVQVLYNSGDPEPLVDLVERLRKYEPIVSVANYKEFQGACHRLYRRISGVLDSNHGKFASSEAIYAKGKVLIPLIPALGRALADGDQVAYNAIKTRFETWTNQTEKTA